MHKQPTSLPKNWEARYDSNQKRYYFINHITKITTWEDPRHPKPSSATAAASSRGHSAGATQSRNAQHNAATGASIHMHDFSPKRTAGTHNPTSTQEEESTLSDPVDIAIIDKLQREFPTASRDVIQEIFQICYKNERETREQLTDMGFDKKKTESPQRQLPQKQPQRATERQQLLATSTQPTESQKKEYLNQLKREFPALDNSVISMALTGCNYSVDNTKTLLHRWEERERESRPSSGSSSSNSSSSHATTSTPTPTPTPASLEPTVMSNNIDSTTPKTLNGATTASSAQQRSAGASQTRPSGPPHMKAQQVTKIKVKTPRKKVTAVTSQPAARGNVICMSDAKGPDANLCKGPDSLLLMNEYALSNGPDSNLRHGPQQSRVNGTMGAMGADPILHCGPQSVLLQKSEFTGFSRPTIITEI